MVCSNCGTEIKDGCVYCEKCGQSIQIVPNFEPEIEERMDETLSAIVDDVLMPTVRTEPVPEEKKEGHSFTLRIILGLCALAVIVGGILIVFFNNTYSAYLNKGIALVSDGNFEASIPLFEKAIQRDKDCTEARVEEANAYRMIGKNDAALRRLYEVVELDDANQAAYDAIISIYEESENYTAINSLLENCSNESIYESYKGYLALPPEFSEEEGTYDKRITLKLMTDNSGTIFYTLDGSEPTKESLKYTMPLELQKGKNVIRAIFVNEKGIVSDSVSKIYEIDILKPDAPVVVPNSGGFITPEYITVTVPEDCKIFYTTDGSTPTESSEEYLGKLPMPIGKSHFKFIAKSSDNLVSDVVDANFVLNFAGACTMEEAANFVTLSLVATGKLLSVEGNTLDKEGKYLYICNSAVKEQGRVYYMVREVYQDLSGTEVKTDQYYAVDAYSCELYRVKRNEQDGFLMETFN